MSTEPNAEDIARRVQSNLSRQSLLTTLGAELGHASPGRVEIEAPFDARFTQQDGYLHAGVVTTLMDSACGYAAYSLMPNRSGVLSVEFKVNFFAPAVGERFRAVGVVIKAGRRLTICQGELYARQEGTEVQVALMQATMIRTPVQPDISGV